MESKKPTTNAALKDSPGRIARPPISSMRQT
jgi:hypothetical protein